MLVPGAIRFLCHIPGFLFALNGFNHYRFVQKHAALLLLPPLNSHGVLYESFAGPGAIALAAWNFLTFVPISIVDSPLIFLFGIVDTIFVCLVGVWLHYEKSFIGMTNPQCDQVPRNGTTDAHLIFFERAWQTNVTSPDFGVTTCKSFMMNWYIGLVVAILYSISALACFCSHGVDFELVWDIITFPVWGTFGLIMLLIDLLPERLHNGIPYYARYAKEWMVHKKDASGVKMHLLPSRDAARKQGPDEYAALLAQVLRKEKSSNYDILQLIARDVDYIDLVNLSLVSKKIRTTVFPSDEDDDEDERQLRLNSCLGNIKSTCWICAIQICQDCSADKFCRESTVSHHMQLCQTKCTSCFRKSLGWKGVGSKKCSCPGWRRPATQRPTHELATIGQERKLCRECVAFSQDELAVMREKRDEAVYKSLSQQTLACSTCMVVLPRTGPRWWVCSMCQLECEGKCHSRWWDWKESV